MRTYLRLSSVWDPAMSRAGGLLLLAGPCGDKHSLRSQQGWGWHRGSGPRLCQAHSAKPTPKGIPEGSLSTALPTALLPRALHLAAQIHLGNASSTSPAQPLLQPLALHGVCLCERTPPTATLQNWSLREPQILLFPRKQPVERFSTSTIKLSNKPLQHPSHSILTCPWPELMEQELSTCWAGLKTPNKSRGKTRGPLTGRNSLL